MRFRVLFVVFFGLLPGCLFCAAGCAPSASKIQSDGALVRVPAAHSLVVPSGEARTAWLLRGLGEPGSDSGPFVGRRDARLGALVPVPERVASGYAQQIRDRQSSNLGRPRNNYSNITSTRIRIDR